MIDAEHETVDLSPNPRRVLLLGATGTIGRATSRALLRKGHDVVCFVRPVSGDRGNRDLPDDAVVRFGDPADRGSVFRDGFRGEAFDAVVSCLASRSGAPDDAWEIDYRAHIHAMSAARASGASQMVLLSAICVQKPRLEFQRAKLAFERELIASGLAYSIVRATALFKSLSGQFDRVRRGKPFLLFGDGKLTACKPISDADLAGYLAECLDDDRRRNRILPIGGPGPAITPIEQGNMLFRALGREPRFRRVPVKMLDAIVFGLGVLGNVSHRMRDSAELARIGRYYATESMLVLDVESGRYDAEATPSTGRDTLFEHYRKLARGEIQVERGDHAVF